MIAPLKWLLSYTDININSKEELHDFTEEMTLTGTKVEGVTAKGADISRVVVAKCLQVEKHENSDHLFVCQLDIGAGEPIQIVTGAQNMRVGAYVPAALDNSTISEGRTIKAGKLRGVPSNGMMCSFEEIGLDCNDYENGNNDGIMILQDLGEFKDCTEEYFESIVGKDIIPVLGADETVIDFELTSNRADCFSILGLAREAAITMHGKFIKPQISVKEECNENAADLISVEVQAPDLCPRYAARVVKDVKIGPSPKWMKERLQAAGVRSINNIVDITNYVMLEYGQPMHAFDKRTIRGNKIIVRRAADGEKITTLDEQERTLDSSMLVIADAQGSTAIAGVMGGLNSEIEPDTTEIVFESAIFDAVTVRRGAKKVGLRTEASLRFEKGLDTVLCLEALDRAAQLVEELGAGKVCQGVIDCSTGEKVMPKIKCSVEGINTFIGISATQEEMEKILIDLECTPCFDKGYVIPPSFRGDLICDADIAEEIARFYGYNKIESRLLNGCATTLGSRNRTQKIQDRMRKQMTGMGYNEMLTFSFISPSVFDKLNLPAECTLRDAVTIQNPLGEDYSIMRTTMMPSFLESIANNYAHRVEEAALFEISYVYIKTDKYPEELPEHREMLTFGKYAANGNADFFEFKGDVEALLESLKITKYEFEPEKEIAFMHPGRTARLFVNGKDAGIFGQIHPTVAKKWGCPANTFAAMFRTDVLMANVTDIPKNKELPKFPAVTRDIAVVLDADVPAGHVEKLIKQRGGKALESCTLFDCYIGAQVPEGKKSLAYALSFRDATKTLTDEDVSKFMKKILNGLEMQFGASLR
ncbi:MAG: phenylalanine--tRNA ligase subunit beta [Ruminococcaceae bacterium]|nr:phenylalanine--tRNA ligase subunit beta [Oscillospiraceae bacterium]